MSEYWVSHKKYFCKYCNIYIADDAPSRSHHENGLRHKGNVERFVRGLYKTGEKRKQDLEEEKREMARVEQAAQAAFAHDVSSGLVEPGSSSTAPPLKPAVHTKPANKSSNPYENYSTAESLGFTDPDAERLKAEAERRQMEGVAGDWEMVATEEPPGHADGGLFPGAHPDAPPQAEAGQKRPLEVLDEDDSRTFKLRRKKMGAGLGELYDPGLIPIKLKTKKEERSTVLGGAGDGGTSAVASSSDESVNVTALPKWSARGWNRPGAEGETHSSLLREGDGTGPTTTASAGITGSGEDVNVKAESTEDTSEQAVISDISKTLEVTVEQNTVKSEETEPSVAPATSGIFRKRKIRGGGAGNRGRLD